MKRILLFLSLSVFFTLNAFAYSIHNRTGCNLEGWVITEDHSEYYTMNWFRNHSSMDGLTPGKPANYYFHLSCNHYDFIGYGTNYHEDAFTANTDSDITLTLKNEKLFEEVTN